MQIHAIITLDEQQVERLGIKEALKEEISYAIVGVLNAQSHPRWNQSQTLDYDVELTYKDG